MSNPQLKSLKDEENLELFPKEILFYVLNPGGSYPYIIMTPEHHFELNGTLYQKSMKLVEIDSLEQYGFKETSPSTFEIEDPNKIKEVVDELRNLGFKESEEFSKFIENKINKKHECTDDCEHDKEKTKLDVLNEKLDELRAELKSKLLEGDSLTKDRLDFEEGEFYKKANVMIEEVMGFNTNDLKTLIAQYVNEHAESLCSKIEYIAENNNFDKGFFDEKQKMISSMRRGATDPNAWKLKAFGNAPNLEHHLYFNFGCDFLNGGEDFTGVVCVDSNGNVKHYFVQKEL